MKVFIVNNGERCEGGRVVSVHLTYEGALKAVGEVEQHFEGGWRLLYENYWENGCDYVLITESEVLP